MKKIISGVILASLLFSAMFTLTACEEITMDELKCKILRDRDACYRWEMKNFKKDLDRVLKDWD